MAPFFVEFLLHIPEKEYDRQKAWPARRFNGDELVKNQECCPNDVIKKETIIYRLNGDLHSFDRVI